MLMKLRRDTFFLYLIPALLLPTLVLTFFSIQSIQTSHQLQERKDLELLERARYQISNTLEEVVQSQNNSLKTIANRLWSHEHFQLENSLQQESNFGLKALFLFKSNTLYFPHLGTNYPLNRPKLTIESPLEKSLFPLQHRRDQWNKQLLERLQLLKTLGLSNDEKSVNELGIIRLYYQLGKFEKVIEYSINFQKRRYIWKTGDTFTQLLPIVWHLQLKSFLALKSNSKAIQLSRNFLKFYFRFSQSFDPRQIAWTFDAIYNQILSLDNLPNKARNTLWNLRSNLQNHLSFSSLYLAHKNTLNELKIEAQFQGQNQFSKFKNGYLYSLLYDQNAESWTVGLYDSSKYHNALENRLYRLQNKQMKFKILFHDYEDLKVTQDQHFWFQHIFAAWSPYQKIIAFKNSANLIQKKRLQKNYWLYSLVGFSIFLLCLGAWYIFHSMNKERQLSQLKGNFLSAVTHELKTPLTSIKMFSEMMEQGRVKKPSKIQEYGQLIGQESNRLQMMIESLLNYSRMEENTHSIRLHSINLTHFIKLICHRMEKLATHKGLEFTSQIEDELYIDADSATLESLVLNIIDNAIKYTPSPGLVSVVLQKTPQGLLLKITDTGIGITKAEQSKIFNVFYRVGDELTRKSKGTGLGLAIVKQAAMLNKINVRIKSQVKKGTSFLLEFSPGKKNG